jgi:hypothetical protein
VCLERSPRRGRFAGALLHRRNHLLGTETSSSASAAAAAGQKGSWPWSPGDAGRYHGGHWAFHAVTFNAGVTPYLLTSEAAVLAAEAAGDVTVTRLPKNDFKCPNQP